MKKIRNDLILIGALFLFFFVLIIIFIFTKEEENLIVSIYYDNELVETVDLSDDKQIEVNNVIIIIKNNEVYVYESSCEDKVCMNLGAIRYSGQTITCLPNRVFIKIEGNKVDVGI